MNRIACLVALLALALSPQVVRAEIGLGITVGGFTGDRLYSATSATPRTWVSPTGAVSGTGDELLVDLESWAQFGLTGFGKLRDRLGIRVDLSFTDVDVDGKVRDASGATEIIEWEQLFVFDVVAQATYRLGRSEETYPWIGLGPSLSVASGEGNSLDQTMPGIAWAAGWRMSALKGSWFEVAVRGILGWPDWADEEARLDATEFEGESMIHGLSLMGTVGRVF